MLKALTVENIAVVKELEIDPDTGFTVITGQTGTGKSVLMQAVALLLGGKASKEIVRNGADCGKVSAIFCGRPDEPPFNSDGEVFLERTVSADGRSSARINGKSVPLSSLRECSASLLSLHSQNETSALYDRSGYIGILDEYADLGEISAKYREIYSRLCAKKNEIAEFRHSLENSSMMTDILKYQISEIDKVRVTDPSEEQKLEKLKAKLKGIEAVTKNANLIIRALSPGEKGASAAYLLERAEAALRQLSDVMDVADELADKLEEYRIEVIDIAQTVRDLIDDEETDDPERQLDRVESRLAAFQKLKKKYGPTLDDVILYRENAVAKLAHITNGTDSLTRLENEYNKIESEAQAVATELSAMRIEAAKALAAEIMDTLKYLDMPKVRFFAEVHRRSGDGRFLQTGIDNVDFTVVTNPGEEPQSLSKIVSGGEASRIMLALKCAQAKKAEAGCVVFDEIDTGVSGGTSERIGIKLSELSRSTQVICVTHSAQVASHADSHFLIEKQEIDGRAESKIRQINGNERTLEIARIIGGISITDKQINAAREMLGNI